jgi:uncharacterized RDD family membrane protein YckC
VEHAPAAEEERKYRTFWRRVGAIILDGAVLAPLAWLDQLLWNHVSHAVLLLPWAILYSLSWIVYEVVFVVAYGQTVGKMACGVRIYAVSGNAVSLGQAVLRQIVPILFLPYSILIQVQNILAGRLSNRALGDDFWSFQAFFLLMLGWVLLEVATMLTNRKRRAVHDFIAGTVVMRETPRPALRWWLVGLLVLSFVVPHFLEERNITATPQMQSKP